MKVLLIAIASVVALIVVALAAIISRWSVQSALSGTLVKPEDHPPPVIAAVKAGKKVWWIKEWPHPQDPEAAALHRQELYISFNGGKFDRLVVKTIRRTHALEREYDVFWYEFWPDTPIRALLGGIIMRWRGSMSREQAHGTARYTHKIRLIYESIEPNGFTVQGELSQTYDSHFMDQRIYGSSSSFAYYTHSLRSGWHHVRTRGGSNTEQYDLFGKLLTDPATMERVWASERANSR